MKAKNQSRNKLVLSKTAIARLSLTRAQMQMITGGKLGALMMDTSAKTSKVAEEVEQREFCTSVTHGNLVAGI